MNLSKQIPLPPFLCLNWKSALRVLALAVCLAQSAALAADPDPLAAGFESPPDSARPQTWWHWMYGNVTKEGITADLEAMKQIGLGGAEIFNADCGIPPGPVKFNSPEWHEMFKHAVAEADRLGLQLEAHNCAGWSSSGGPWNVASNGMMRVVSSEVRVTGPKDFSGALPQPPEQLGFYRDIAVLAFRTPDGEGPASVRPKVTTSVADQDAAALVDGKHAVTVTLPKPTNGHPQFVELEFSGPFVTRTLQLTPGAGISSAKGVIQVSSDGVKFRDCAEFSLPHRPTRPVVFSLGEDAVAARFYRVVFNSMGKDAKNIALRGLDFSPRLRIADFETKDGDTGSFVNSMSDDSRSAGGAGLRRNKMIDLTSRLRADGTLHWRAPRGEWTILRVGYTPSGRENHPAPAEGTGLECDKFSKAALDAHWAGFMQKLVADAGPLAGKTFVGGVIDSYEVGGQNWSANFRDEFRERRGYDPVPYLAAFTGRVVDSPQVTERFLWDVRRTIADLFADNYYGHFTELCHSNGLISSIEPYTGPYESLQCGSLNDIVMGEFWSGSQGDPSVKLAASVAHIYGKQLVGAESFTAGPAADHGRWLDTPYSLKALGDMEYCTGLNRYIFHRYAMQPWTNRWPGMTMGQWGIHLDRTETWWQQGKAWIDYVSRCQFLLQQGRYVADAAYFMGESAPSEMPEIRPALPPGYEYDAINADVLLHHARVRDGRLTLDSGASYAVLVLPADNPNITPELLGRIREFVHDGLTVVGARPQYSPSLENYPHCDGEVRSLANAMWGKCDGVKITEHAYGKGRVAWGEPLTNIFAKLDLPPDFAFASYAGTDSSPNLRQPNADKLSVRGNGDSLSPIGGEGQGEGARVSRSPKTDSNIIYCHRQTPTADIYFVSNQRQRFDTAECSFRVTGRAPELWDPETGVMQPAPVWREENGRTMVPLQFAPAGSVFVVFRSVAHADHFVSIEHPATGIVEKPAPAELKIIHAAYGSFSSSGQSVDVTDKLASQVADGGLSVRAENALAGDPAPNISKELRVDYTLNGVSKHVTVAEGEMLELPDAQAAHMLGHAPSFEMSAQNGEGGETVLHVFEPGDFTLRTASGKTVTAAMEQLPEPMEITGDWQLSFPTNWGAPDSVTLDKLISWTDHTNTGVKYFSGTATYTKEFEIPSDDLGATREVWLDLGAVKNFAEVSLNGKAYGVLWKPPFRVNITGAAQAGTNVLEVKVTNLWPNRLIGDEQLPADREWNGKQLASWPQWVLDGKPSPTGRLTFTTWHHWTKDDALLESGLLGPVMVKFGETKTVRAE